MNYVSYFNSLGCKKYMVHFIADSGDTFTEIKLAWETPFKLTYETSNTPFEPVRTATADIRIVHNDYLQDLMSPYAHGTKVILYDISNGENSKTVEWTGFLQPKLFNQGYVNEYEDIEFTANDCLNTLQYIDYESVYTYHGFVTIKSILDQICNKCESITGYYWTRSKKVGNTVLLPSMLQISEQNFFYDDTDEPWKLDAVLEEICRYLGVTCIQWKDKLYFVDYQVFHGRENMYMTYFAKATDYAQGSNVYLDSAYTIDAQTYMGESNDISFQPIYNKVKVKANFYDAEYFIPNIFDDRFLTNRIGDHEFYQNQEIPPATPDVPAYPHGAQWWSVWQVQKWKHDGSGDSAYTYYERLYDHDYWESVYMDEYNNVYDLTEEERASTAITLDYKGGTIMDLGVVKKEYLDEYGQLIVPDQMDYTRYVCCCLKYRWNNGEFNGLAPMLKLRDGFRSNVFMSPKSFLVLNFSMLWERYNNRNYINPDWTDESCSVWTLGRTESLDENCGLPRFKLKIGNQWWNGEEWTTTDSLFTVVTERTSEQRQKWNTELQVLNNVSWDEMVNEKGYKIPLEGVDCTQDIQFSIISPIANWYWMDAQGVVDMQYNAYVWYKDLSLKCVEVGQEAERVESDVVYENEIDVDAVSELSDITVKLTTYNEMVRPSYSNVVLNNGNESTLLSAVTEQYIDGVAKKPEENIVQKYVEQYSTPTKQFELDLSTDITPFSKVYSAYVEDPTEAYCVVGQEIDFQREGQIITLIQKK